MKLKDGFLLRNMAGSNVVIPIGHAVLICGYDRDGVLVMNSWGSDYGRDGKIYVSRKAFDRQFMYGAVLTGVLDGLE